LTGSGRKGPLFFIVAGDPSGDIHAANLIGEIRRICPDARFAGMGGARMREAGCDELYDLVDNLAVMWFASVIVNMGRVIKSQRIALEYIDREKPDLVIFIDFPGFNITLGRWLRKRPVRIAYYILPQVWAWFSHRWRRIRKLSHEHVVILPFEKEWYARRGMEVEYVGHPLYDHLAQLTIAGDLRQRIGAREDEKLLGLLPGSRAQEMLKKLRVMLKTAREIQREVPKLRVLVSPAQGLDEAKVRRLARRCGVEIDIVPDAVYEMMKSCDLCLVASGTATLELAWFETPMIVLYRLAWFGFPIARASMQVPHMALVNLVAGREVVPEILLWRDDFKSIAADAIPILSDEAVRAKMIEGMRRVNDQIAHPGATARAAELLARRFARDGDESVDRRPGLG